MARSKTPEHNFPKKNELEVFEKAADTTKCRKSKKRTFPSLFLYDWSWKNVPDSRRTEAKKLPCFGQKLVRTTVLTMGHKTPSLLCQERKKERMKEIKKKKRRPILLKYTTPLLKTQPPLGGPLIQKNTETVSHFLGSSFPSSPFTRMHQRRPCKSIKIDHNGRRC